MVCSKHHGEVVFDCGEPTPVFDWGVGALIRNVGNTSEVGVVAPCMSFDNVAVEVG